MMSVNLNWSGGAKINAYGAVVIFPIPYRNEAKEYTWSDGAVNNDRAYGARQESINKRRGDGTPGPTIVSERVLYVDEGYKVGIAGVIRTDEFVPGRNNFPMSSTYIDKPGTSGVLLYSPNYFGASQPKSVYLAGTEFIQAYGMCLKGQGQAFFAVNGKPDIIRPADSNVYCAFLLDETKAKFPQLFNEQLLQSALAQGVQQTQSVQPVVLENGYEMAHTAGGGGINKTPLIIGGVAIAAIAAIVIIKSRKKPKKMSGRRKRGRR